MSLTLWLILSYGVVLIFGVLLHFTHGWLKNGFLLHIFSAVNESTWEHMKLSYIPMFFITLLQYIAFGYDHQNFWVVGLITSVTATALIPILYYPIKAVIGKEVTVVSISLYFVCVLLAYLLEYYLLMKEIVLLPWYIGIIGLFALLFLFGIFTYFPPQFFIFKDPVGKRYGDPV